MRFLCWTAVWLGVSIHLSVDIFAQANVGSRIPDSVRDRETIANDPEMTPRVDNEPLDPSQKGFMTIPGTVTRIRLGGYARLDLLHDLSPIGSTDDFVVATIPMDRTDNSDNTRIHARQSRLNVELRRPSPLGEARILFETDFFGSGGERAFNLRNAYGQAANVLAGFTASTVADPDARADTLDHEGPPARVSTRHAQLRWTRPFSARQTLAVAIEQPDSDVSRVAGDRAVTPQSPWPDLVTRYRLDARRGHLQASGVYRSVGGSVQGDSDDRQTFAAAAVVSGSLVIVNRNTLVWEWTAGRGIARYVKDTSGLGLDAAIDEFGRFRPLALVGGVVGYQHRWNERWRSTVAGSFVDLEALSTQPADTYRRSQYLTTNLLYKPVGSVTIGVEVDRGRLTVLDGRSNDATRVQFAIQYNLIE